MMAPEISIAKIMVLACVNIKTSNFMANPVNGGRPPKDKIVIASKKDS